MTANIGIMDKIFRLSIVLIIGALYLVKAIEGMTAIVFGIIATYLILTSFLGTSPFYLIFKFSSVEKKKASKKRRR